MTDKLKCARCGYDGPFRVGGDGKTEGRFYGRMQDSSIHCDVCCGELDTADAMRTGRAVLYLSFPCNPRLGRGASVASRIGLQYLRYRPEEVYLTNWPGTLRLPVKDGLVKAGRHNFAGIRYDVWFIGPDGKEWHGVQYGDNTQICHCKRVGK